MAPLCICDKESQCSSHLQGQASKRQSLTLLSISLFLYDLPCCPSLSDKKRTETEKDERAGKQRNRETEKQRLFVFSINTRLSVAVVYI